jgi:hypothetical protein
MGRKINPECGGSLIQKMFIIILPVTKTKISLSLEII